MRYRNLTKIAPRRVFSFRYWLHYTLGMLIQQQLRFTVFVVEQEGKGVFNKGQLMNTAFQWALKNDTTKWDCYIFHDVDMLPEIVGNLYMCSGDEKLNFKMSSKSTLNNAVVQYFTRAIVIFQTTKQ